MKCSFKNCKREHIVIYLDRPLCPEHWGLESKKEGNFNPEPIEPINNRDVKVVKVFDDLRGFL